MSEKISNIAKNTSYFTLALILQKVISFTYFTLLARALGPEDLGKYYFAISFTTIFSIFIDLGFSNVLTREVAKSDQETESYLGSIMALKIPLSIISLLAVVGIIEFLHYPALTRDLVLISSVSMILDSFTLTFFAVARGFHNLLYESISSIIFQFIVLIIGLFVLYSGFSLRWQMFALVLASLFNFSYSLILLIKKWKVKIRPNFNKALLKNIIVLTLPFAMYGIFSRLFTYLDSVLLSILAGDKYVGLYQVAFKIINALQFLPAAFAASLYPALSAYWVRNREQLAVTFERAMNYLIIISLPIAVGIVALADKIVTVFKGGYGGAVLPLQITIISVPFMFLGFPLGSLLNACDRQKANTVIMGIVMAVSTILNLILIPHYKAVGASFTNLVTNILMFVLAMALVPKIMTYHAKKNIILFFKAFAAVAVMGIFAWYLKARMNIFIVVALGGLLYFCLLFLFGGFKKEDVTSILKSFSRKGAPEKV